MYQITTKLPNGHNIFRMARIYSKWLEYIPNGHIIYQPFPFQGPPNFTQILVFLAWKYTIWQPWEAAATKIGWMRFRRHLSVSKKDIFERRIADIGFPLKSVTGWPDWENFMPFGWLFTLDSFSKNLEVALILGLLFYSAKVVYQWRKRNLATFWAIVSQTHLVTLVGKWTLLAKVQGDQMSLWKSNPKCSPTNFLPNFMHNRNRGI
jgi:hypothetical protein